MHNPHRDVLAPVILLASASSVVPTRTVGTKHGTWLRYGDTATRVREREGGTRNEHILNTQEERPVATLLQQGTYGPIQGASLPSAR